MKLAGYYVRLRHKPARIICDTLSLGVVLFTLVSTHLMMERFPELKTQFFRSDCVKLWMFPVLALVVFAVYFVFIFTNHRLAKFRITEKNAQDVFDWYVFSVSLCKLPALVAIADVMTIFQSRLLGQDASWFSMGYIFYALILAIIIRLSLHRIRKLTEPEKTVSDDRGDGVFRVRVADRTDDNADEADDTKKGN